jgi:hypothetical protein
MWDQVVERAVEGQRQRFLETANMGPVATVLPVETVRESKEAPSRMTQLNVADPRPEDRM